MKKDGSALSFINNPPVWFLVLLHRRLLRDTRAWLRVVFRQTRVDKTRQ